MIDETIRLYSRQARCPVDVIAPQHQDVHALCERWGAWNAERYRAGTSGSVESRYREQTPHATGDGVDPRMIQVERAVLRMPKDYRDTVRMFYVTRTDPRTICKIFTLRYEAFGPWMFTARAMIVNLLRRHGCDSIRKQSDLTAPPPRVNQP